MGIQENIAMFYYYIIYHLHSAREPEQHKEYWLASAHPYNDAEVRELLEEYENAPVAITLQEETSQEVYETRVGSQIPHPDV